MKSGLLFQQVLENVEASLKGTTDRDEEFGVGGQTIKGLDCRRGTGVGDPGEGSKEENRGCVMLRPKGFAESKLTTSKPGYLTNF